MSSMKVRFTHIYLERNNVVNILATFTLWNDAPVSILAGVFETRMVILPTNFVEFGSGGSQSSCLSLPLFP